MNWTPSLSEPILDEGICDSSCHLVLGWDSNCKSGKHVSIIVARGLGLAAFTVGVSGRRRVVSK